MGKDKLRFAVLMDVAFSYFQEGARWGIRHYLKEAGIDAVYFGMGGFNPSSPDDQAKAAFIDFITPGEFDGIIIISTSLTNSDEETVRARIESLKGIPMVSIGHSLIGEDNIIVDNMTGIRMIMEHLLKDHGYRRFAYVSGPLTNHEARCRLDTYRSALDSAGIIHSENEEYEGNFLPPSGFAAVSAFLDERGLKPEVIVCANDFMAIGVWDCLLARGLSVPGDIAITGFDDAQMSRSLTHQFTTVSQSFYELGYRAAERLHALIGGDDLPKVGYLIPSLRIRSSCGCVEFDKRQRYMKDVSGNDMFEMMKKRIESFSLSGNPPREIPDLYNMWVGIVRKALSERRPVYELDEMISGIGKSIHVNGNIGINDFLLPIMRSLMLQECGQMVFVDYWNDSFFTMDLRVAIDRLQYEMNRDLSLTGHSDCFRDVADKCQAGQFHIVRFNDSSKTGKGGSIVYSSGGNMNSGNWLPGPGSWLPEGCGSVVANMLVTDGKRFGYFLLDADVTGSDTFEDMRIRLSKMFRDMVILQYVRQLNSEMIDEIAARVESERKLKDALSMVRKLSIEDELTHLNNRRGFLALAEQQVKYLRRQNAGFFLLYADLDGLKGINDKWGHKEGDTAIRSAAKILHTTLRDSDIVARLGGDEFAALVNIADSVAIDIIVQRIEKACKAMSEELGRDWKLSISVGHFYADSDCQLNVEQMLDLADSELYRNKHKKKAARDNV